MYLNTEVGVTGREGYTFHCMTFFVCVQNNNVKTKVHCSSDSSEERYVLHKDILSQRTELPTGGTRVEKTQIDYQGSTGLKNNNKKNH